MSDETNAKRSPHEAAGAEERDAEPVRVSASHSAEPDEQLPPEPPWASAEPPTSPWALRKIWLWFFLIALLVLVPAVRSETWLARWSRAIPAAALSAFLGLALLYRWNWARLLIGWAAIALAVVLFVHHAFGDSPWWDTLTIPLGPLLPGLFLLSPSGESFFSSDTAAPA